MAGQISMVHGGSFVLPLGRAGTQMEMAARQHLGTVQSEALRLQHAPCALRLGRERQISFIFVRQFWARQDGTRCARQSAFAGLTHSTLAGLGSNMLA